MNAGEDASKDATRVAGVCLLLGVLLSRFGASAQRVSDSMRAVGGEDRVEPMVGYESIGVTVKIGSETRTEISGSLGVSGVNIDGLVQISRVVRAHRTTPVPLVAFQEALDKIAAIPALWPPFVCYVASAFAAAVFALVNAGDPGSWLIAGVAGLGIFALRKALLQKQANLFLATTFAAFLGTIPAALMILGGWTQTPGIALIAATLPLTPGVVIMNAGADAIFNRISLTVSRLGFTLCVMLAVAIGVGIFVPLLGDQGWASHPYRPPEPWPLWLPAIGGAVGAAVLTILNNGSALVVAVCALGGFVGRFVRTACVEFFGLDPVLAAFLGAIAISLLLLSFAERLRLPVVVMSVVCVLPLIPGFLLIQALANAFEFTTGPVDSAQTLLTGVAAAQALFLAVAECGALAIGILGPVTLFQWNKKRI